MQRIEVSRFSGWFAIAALTLGVILSVVLIPLFLLGGFAAALANFVLTSLVATAVVFALVAFGVWKLTSPLWHAQRAEAPRSAAREQEPVPAGGGGAGATPSPAQPAPQAQGDVLQGVDIFRDLSPEQRAQIAAIGRLERLTVGDSLGVQGGRGEAVYALLAGHVELFVASPSGQLTVRIAGPGESLPLAALLGDGTLITSARAMTDVEALVLPRLHLLNLCAERPEIGMRLFSAVAEILGDRYRSTLQRLTQQMDRIFQESELWANV
jgi:CRP/FNR family cyclic AMP-dependent transcriptional regulator